MPLDLFPAILTLSLSHSPSLVIPSSIQGIRDSRLQTLKDKTRVFGSIGRNTDFRNDFRRVDQSRMRETNARPERSGGGYVE